MKNLIKYLQESLRIGLNDKPEENVFDVLKEKYEYMFNRFDLDPTSATTRKIIYLGFIKEDVIETYHKCFYRGDYLGDPVWSIIINEKTNSIELNCYINYCTGDDFQYRSTNMRSKPNIYAKTLDQFIDKMDEFIETYGIRKKGINESLRIGIDDEPEHDIESTDTLYRVDITKDCIYMDIHTVKGLLIHKNSVGVRDAISITCGVSIDGDFEYVPDDNYMFSYIRNNQELRLFFLPEAKDKFYNLFDPIYSFGHGLKIVIDDVCDLLGIDSITKMLQDWVNYALTINSKSDILDAIHKYENNDK